MKHRKIILNEYQNKIKLLKIYNKSYFVNDSPKVSDADYDKQKEIIDLEKKYPFILEKYSSVNTIIGAPVASKISENKTSKTNVVIV